MTRLLHPGHASNPSQTVAPIEIKYSTILAYGTCSTSAHHMSALLLGPEASGSLIALTFDFHLSFISVTQLDVLVEEFKL